MSDKTLKRKLKNPAAIHKGELHNGRLSQIKNHNADETSTANEFYTKKE